VYVVYIKVNHYLLTDKTNQPIWSRNAYAMGSTLHHLDNSYRVRTFHTPQFSPLYIMNASAMPETHYMYTNQEIRILNQMGYSIKNPYSGELLNRPPRFDGEIIEEDINPTIDANGNFNYLDFAAPLGYNPPSLQNDVGASFTINLNNANFYGFFDDDGDLIRVFPNSIVNIRGCSQGPFTDGSTNYNSVVYDPGNNQIIFTPRNNFVGRAQFGFNLYDGIEIGTFVMVTIDVTDGSAVDNGNELVLNGTFEEGSETLTLDNLTVPRTYIDYLGFNRRFADCTNIRLFLLAQHDYKGCGQYGLFRIFGIISSLTFGPLYVQSLVELLAVSPPAENYRYLHGYEDITYNFILSKPVLPGGTYQIAFDMSVDDDGMANTEDFNFIYGFGTDINTNVVPNSMIEFFDQPDINLE